MKHNLFLKIIGHNKFPLLWSRLQRVVALHWSLLMHKLTHHGYMCCIQVGAMSQPSVSGFTAGSANTSMYKVRVPRWGTNNAVYLKFWSKFTVGCGEGHISKGRCITLWGVETLWSGDDDVSDNITENWPCILSEFFVVIRTPSVFLTLGN